MNNKENIMLDVDTLLNNNQDNESNLKNQTIEIEYNDFYSDLLLADNYDNISKEQPTSTLDNNIISKKLKIIDDFENLNNIKKNIYNEINYILNKKKVIKSDSYYNEVLEYHGVIHDIDEASGKFFANIVNAKNKNENLNAEFEIGDIQYESDKDFIRIGAQFIWMIGQETKLLYYNDNTVKKGSRNNVSRFYFRRMRSLSKKEREKAKLEANEWTEFFRKYDFE